MKYVKYYALYNNVNQTKFLSFAANMEALNVETEYHNVGVWFEYDLAPGSNLLLNEKQLDGIVFPINAKQRSYNEWVGDVKPKFKWLS